MKKMILSVLAIGSMCALAGHAAQAGQTDDGAARLAALEKENAAIRKENAALLDNKQLRQRNATLKSDNAQIQPPASAISVPPITPSAFDAYAADLPVAYKAPVESRGQFRVSGEGGAFWSGGDSVTSNYTLTDFTGLGAIAQNGGNGVTAGAFDLTPKVGWEAAAGFDYRFANSPWHISGQFRYGESGKASGTASSAGTVDPAIFALLGGNNNPFAGGTLGGNQDIAASYNETHWLADLAVGRDVIGTGSDAMQLKAGIRIAELTGTLRTSNNSNTYLNFPAPVDFLGIGTPFSSYAFGDLAHSEQRDSFLGIGPRIGIEGSVPIAGNWAFDYLSDAALLFGNQKQRITSTSQSTISPALLAALIGGGGTSSVATDQRSATLFNADIQVGVSYWLRHNVKLSASYRLDAFVNVTDPLPGSMQTVNRYIHGPRLGVSGTF